MAGIDDVKASFIEESLAAMVGDDVDIALIARSLVVGLFLTPAILETVAEAELGRLQAIEPPPRSEAELVRID